MCVYESIWVEHWSTLKELSATNIFLLCVINIPISCWQNTPSQWLPSFLSFSTSSIPSCYCPMFQIQFVPKKFNYVGNIIYRISNCVIQFNTYFLNYHHSTKFYFKWMSYRWRWNLSICMTPLNINILKGIYFSYQEGVLIIFQ